MSGQKNIYLGVDGGGTKTEAVLIDEDGKVIGQGQAGGSNPGIIGYGKSVENVYLSVKNIAKNVEIACACFAIAGVNTKEDEQKFKNTIQTHSKLSNVSKKILVVNDTRAALRTGTASKNAIVLISGTGSSCWGINDKGWETKSGGWGHILADQGSGYAIGLSILKEVTRELDGRAQKSLLSKVLLGQLKISSFEELDTLIHKKPWNKTDIANIAPVVDVAFGKGDKKAKEIIEKAVEELFDMIFAVSKKLDFLDRKFTLVLTGSVFNLGEITRLVEEKVLEMNPKIEIVKPTISSAYGAALLAKEQI